MINTDCAVRRTYGFEKYSKLSNYDVWFQNYSEHSNYDVCFQYYSEHNNYDVYFFINTVSVVIKVYSFEKYSNHI